MLKSCKVRKRRPIPRITRHPRWRFALMGLLALVFIISLINITGYVVRSYQNRARQEELSTRHEEAARQAQALEADSAAAPPPVRQKEVVPVPPTERPSSTPPAPQTFFKVIGLTLASLKPFVKQNSDTVGWIKLEGLVDLPVVYRDNTYYLTRDFDRHHNACGAIFLDENTPIRSDSQNLKIYGHNMKDGSMFGRLLKYTGNDYLRNHSSIAFDTRFESFTYIIFAVCRVSADGTNHKGLDFRGHASFADEADFNTYIDQVYEQSLYSRYLDVTYSDTLLNLVTCIDDDRLVLVARRQRDNETQADIRRCMLGLYTR